MKNFKIKLKSIVKCDGRYLLVKKWYDDRITEPYQWEFLDLELPFGISPEEAVLEYTASATNLTVSIERVLYTWTYVMGESQYIGLAYLCDAVDDTVFVSEELSDYIWVSYEELENYIGNKAILDDARKGLKIYEDIN